LDRNKINKIEEGDNALVNDCTVDYTTAVVQESSIDLVTKFGKSE